MNTRAGTIAFAMTCALGACASAPKVRVDQAQVDLTQCKTFAWHAPTDQAASFTDQRVRHHAMVVLKEKGYAEAATSPDCRISYVLSTHSRPKSGPGVGVGVGGGSRGVGGGIGVTLPIGRKNSEAARFTVDIIDSQKNAQIWSGTIEDTLASTELSDEEAQRLVKRVLAEFPDRSGDL